MFRFFFFITDIFRFGHVGGALKANRTPRACDGILRHRWWRPATPSLTLSPLFPRHGPPHDCAPPSRWLRLSSPVAWGGSPTAEAAAAAFWDGCRTCALPASSSVGGFVDGGGGDWG